LVSGHAAGAAGDAQAVVQLVNASDLFQVGA
jgi:hypothetical protein